MSSSLFPSGARELLAEALRVLGVRNLVLGIHDQCFPSLAGEDVGRGSPYSTGAAHFLEQVPALGATGLQLGPQGQTSESNPSPYDGTIFSRNTLNLALAELFGGSRWGGLLSARTYEELLRARPATPAIRTSHRYVYGAVRTALREAQQTLLLRSEAGEAKAKELLQALQGFQREQSAWLERDAMYAALTAEYLGTHWSRWSDLDQQLWPGTPTEATRARRSEISQQRAMDLDRYALGQLIVHTQHAALRAHTERLGLKLYGDLQVGLSTQDCWSYGDLFFPDYLMGAPPSRTNPEGQAWGYPILDPERYFEEDGKTLGPSLRLMSARMNKLLSEFDGVRLDHPHGLCCPWVYRSHAPDPLESVRQGARLFCSPDLPDHPDFAQFAIPLPEQINHAVPRYADNWVRDLDDEQVARYSTQFEVVEEAMRVNDRDPTDLICEVLSTMPYPLGRVLQRFGLGRFRVTQKANLKDPHDVYRSENALPADWVMVGNHDTPPLWRVVEDWFRTGLAADQAAYLAQRLKPESERSAFAQRLASSAGELANAKFADLFVSQARNVMVFFTDWFGYSETYNAPGTVNDDNWNLRLTTHWAEDYRKKLTERRAFNLPAALALAIRAPGSTEAPAPEGLADRLDELAHALANPAR